MYWRLQRLREHLILNRVLAHPQDITTFKTLRYEPAALTGPASLHVKQLGGGPVLCRPGTSDSVVFWEAFYHRYHLPPRGLRPVRCIVDLGANVGYTAAHFAHLYPQARIVAVEMDPENADLFTRNNAALGSRCQLIRAAVWRNDGTIHYAGDQAWSFHVSDPASGDGNGHRTVPAKRLETIFDELDLRTIDYLKMDIEGAEAEVLQPPMNWASRVRAMKIELHPPADYDRCAAALTACGFRCRPDRRRRDCLVARSRKRLD